MELLVKRMSEILLPEEVDAEDRRQFHSCIEEMRATNEECRAISQEVFNLYSLARIFQRVSVTSKEGSRGEEEEEETSQEGRQKELKSWWRSIRL